MIASPSFDFDRHAVSDYCFLRAAQSIPSVQSTRNELPILKIPRDRVANPLLTLQRSIEVLAAMPPNWDGYGALPIDPLTAENAMRAVEALSELPSPEITPNPNGTLSFEWQSKKGLAHLEIGKTRYSCYIALSSTAPLYADGAADRIPLDLADSVAAHLYPSLQRSQASTTYNLPATHGRTAY